jgi:hypothetical protein
MGRREFNPAPDYDAADEVEHTVWAALERAKIGQATADDWMLIEWACGFSHTQRPNLNIQAAF